MQAISKQIHKKKLPYKSKHGRPQLQRRQIDPIRLKTFIAAHPRANLADLAREFHVTEQAISKRIRKDKIPYLDKRTWRFGRPTEPTSPAGGAADQPTELSQHHPAVGGLGFGFAWTSEAHLHNPVAASQPPFTDLLNEHAEMAFLTGAGQPEDQGFESLKTRELKEFVNWLNADGQSERFLMFIQELLANGKPDEEVRRYFGGWMEGGRVMFEHDMQDPQRAVARIEQYLTQYPSTRHQLGRFLGSNDMARYTEVWQSLMRRTARLQQRLDRIDALQEVLRENARRRLAREIVTRLTRAKSPIDVIGLEEQIEELLEGQPEAQQQRLQEALMQAVQSDILRLSVEEGILSAEQRLDQDALDSWRRILELLRPSPPGPSGTTPLGMVPALGQ